MFIISTLSAIGDVLVKKNEKKVKVFVDGAVELSNWEQPLHWINKYQRLSRQEKHHGFNSSN